MISPFEQTLRALSDASRQYEAELARFALNTQRVAKRDAAQIVHTAERLIRRTHAQLRSSSIAIRRRRRRARRRNIQTDAHKLRSSSSSLSSNDVLVADAAATARHGGRASAVRQLLTNDRSRRTTVSPVPLVAPLDDVRPSSPRASTDLPSASPAHARDHNGSRVSAQSQQSGHERQSASDASPHRQQSSAAKPSARDRRSTATVESYDTANADFSDARAVPDTDAAASPLARSHAESLRSQPSLTQSEHPQSDHDQQSPSVQSGAVASSARERSPRSSPPQQVPLQEEHQVQRMQQTPQCRSNQSASPNKLSESLHLEPNRSRSSAHTSSSFENDAPADESGYQSETKSAEQEMNIQPDQIPLSPRSHSKTACQTSFSPHPESDANHLTPESGTKHRLTGDRRSTASELEEKTEGSPEAETESKADDTFPESIQQTPAPVASLENHQLSSPPDAVQVDEESESALAHDSEHSELKLESSPGRNRASVGSGSHRSRQRESEHQVDAEMHSVQTRGEASEETLAKEVYSSSDAKPVAETKTGTSEAAQVSTKSGGGPSPEVLPGVSSSMPAPKQVPVSRIPRKPSRILVDNAGKIDHSSLSALSRIISTKSVEKTTVDSQVNTSTQKLTTPRTTKLFKPNNNIYSLQQNAEASPAQRFSSSNRSSILSHTPGAEAPFRRHSPAVSRHQRLESLNRQLESFQNSKGAGLQGPELQMAELRHGRTGAQVLGDLGNPEISQFATEDENVFRSVRERTLKLAETHVKDTSKVDIWSLRAKGAKTTPARDKLRARERSKSKSAFRSQLQEIMTGKTSSPEDDEHEENKADLVGSRFLVSSGNEDSMVDPRIPENGEEEKLSKKLSTDGDRCNPIVIPSAVAEPTTVETKSLLSQTQGPCLEADNTAKGNDPFSKLPAASSSHALAEQQNTSVPDVCMPDIQKAPATNAPLTNLMTSIVSFLPGSSSLLGTRPTREQSEESEAEAAAKRQKLDMERREAEVQARREAQRLLKQKETEEKQRRAEKRRLLLARADKEKEEEKRKKEERRMRKKLEEEEARKKKKLEDDRKKEERRRLVLEKKAQNEMKLKRKKKGAEPLPPRKLPKGLSGKSWVLGQGASHAPDTDFPGHEKHKLSGTPSTPVTKKKDASQGQSNYDMTPAQETVFELSDEEEERRKHKRIPQWAQGPKLSTAARDQPDPDDVFVNVPTCDLREVFGNVRRFRPRSSSANWTKDRVTAQEMLKFRKGQSAYNEPPQ